MIRLIGGDEVFGTGETGEDPEIGLISSRIEEGGGKPNEVGQRMLELDVRGEVARQEARGACAKAMAGGRLRRCRRELGVVGEPEIVVG